MKYFVLIIFGFLVSYSKQFGQENKIENLGPEVNSIYDERAPVISPDGKILYFTRGGDPNNTGYYTAETEQDIWYSVLQKDSTWSKAINIGPPLNTIKPNSICSITPDGNTILLLGRYQKDGTVRQGYSISHRTSSGWSFPEPLNIKNYYNDDRYSNACMNNDGNVLLMAIDRLDSRGLKDIFVSFKEKDSTWSAPRNLGPVINTFREEYSPFIASDGKSLYFSSMGHKGFGGYDVFVSRRLDSTWQNWTEPKNLGRNINTASDDLFFRIPSSGDYVYFLSYENSYGEGDIFRTLLPDSVRPNPVALVSGHVYFAGSWDWLNATIHYESLPDFIEIGTARTDPLSGEYKITLPTGQKYRYYATARDFISSGGEIDLTANHAYMEIEKNIELSPIETGLVMSLNDIYFDEGSAEISNAAELELSQAVLLLNGHTNAKIEITALPGKNENMENINGLLRKRAKNVIKYIVAKYISANRLSFKISTENKENAKPLIKFRIIK